MRVLANDISAHIEKEIELLGWVAVRRDHGKLIFIDLRDRSGVAQVVFLPSEKRLSAGVSELRSAGAGRL